MAFSLADPLRDARTVMTMQEKTKPVNLKKALREIRRSSSGVRNEAVDFRNSKSITSYPVVLFGEFDILPNGGNADVKDGYIIIAYTLTIREAPSSPMKFAWAFWHDVSFMTVRVSVRFGCVVRQLTYEDFIIMIAMPM
ncbi:hypothetical protein BC938DRAFT_479138 [Jimgerdemannia flammicorona]|uniref:Uncharacterized protein n=1 Tax=Jimgerdemannia flammicorona TaxID=994334 RepID=A0A433QLG9_9FUNG|nr:hypothetical protein BC938DRAFT_479138 [Jimgerdemannia flammicorona]